MTKRALKKTFSTIIAMTAILLALIAIRPGKFAGAVGTLGDEDDDTDVFAIVDVIEDL